MTTLTITSRDRPGIQKIEVPARDAVLIAPDGSGTVDMAATGANVLVRFGSPAADARDFIVVHDGDHRELSSSRLRTHWPFTIVRPTTTETPPR